MPKSSIFSALSLPSPFNFLKKSQPFPPAKDLFKQGQLYSFRIHDVPKHDNGTVIIMKGYGFCRISPPKGTTASIHQ